MKNKPKLNELLDAEKFGKQIFLEIKIFDCYSYTLKVKNIGNSKRQINNIGNELLKFNPRDGKIFNLDFSESSNRLTRTIDGKLNSFDIHFTDLEFTNMQVNPNILFSVRKSPWSNTIPQVVIKAQKTDENGQWITYYPFQGSINEFDKEIDISKV
jgi:hypothetical protein